MTKSEALQIGSEASCVRYVTGCATDEKTGKELEAVESTILRFTLPR